MAIRDKNPKTCFVIAPIGKEASEERVRSDQVLKHIITPAVRECGYEAIRADQISEPGIITSQVIQHIVDDPLVIADLTGRNPNVFYELALRHALKKPVVQIIHANELIPFDVAPTRTIQLDHHDLDSVARVKDQIIEQIRAVEKNPTDVDNPISVAIDVQLLRLSDNPLEKSNAEIITMLQDLRSAIAELREEPRRLRVHPALIEDLAMMFDRSSMLLQLEEGKLPSPKQMEELRLHQRRTERLLMHLCEEAGIPARMLLSRRDRHREPQPISKEGGED